MCSTDLQAHIIKIFLLLNLNHAVNSAAVRHVICLGDFNFYFLDVGSSTYQDVSNFIESLGLAHTPTQITASTSKFLDYILVSDEISVTDASIIYLVELSDHESVQYPVSFSYDLILTTLKQVRDFKNLNFNQFQADLMSLPWNTINELPDVNSKVGFLNRSIIQLLNIFAPFIKIRITKHYAPWRTDTQSYDA